ncbi:MAG: glycoside hydrolase family 3 C-terminal domain-containing protein [Bacilli bacterium]|nr:glycoside hydrolase family 3 C-terminal domain-containing protein [Bacilli bacterium]
MPILENTKNAVNKLNNKQKAKLLYGNGEWETNPISGTTIGSVVMHDGPCGLRIPTKGGMPQPGSLVQDAEPSTCYPAPCLIACSWNVKAIERMASSYAYEARLQGTDVVLCPGINIKRNPLCGRNFEYFSEDPVLSGKLGAAYINGLQNGGVGATIKHFAVNNQEFCRNICSSEVDLRALNEIYLKGFEIAIKESDPWAVMCSYNPVNGIAASDNIYLTKTTLRERWGYDGVLMSDWGATYNVVSSHENGLDLQMPCSDNHSRRISRAVKKNRLSQQALDDSSLRVANMYFKTLSKPELLQFDCHEEARLMAEESIVLVKNDKLTKTGYKCALPLSSYKDACVIGALAKYPRYQGDGSSKVTVSPENLRSFVDVINEGKDSDQTVPYCQGYSYSFENDCEYFGISKKALLKHFNDDEKKAHEYVDQKFLNEAVNLASTHETIVVFLGIPPREESEGFDRSHMILSKQQLELFKSIASIKKSNPKKKIVTVISSGSPIELEFALISDAILRQYLPGESGAEALNNIILGNVNPSGKLAESWPLRGMDVPSYDSFGKYRHKAMYKESIFVGYRYYLSSGRDVLFPFGYGLSYTNFDYSDLQILTNEISNESEIIVSLCVKNTGKFDGSEIVQIYSSYIEDNKFASPENTVIRPLRELKAFHKVALKKGQKKRITLSIPASSLSFFDPVEDKYLLQSGKYSIQVASSCENVKLSQNIYVQSKDVVKPENVDSGYFTLSKSGLYIVPNKNFYDHLGDAKTDQQEPKKFTIHSTYNDISKTWIGSIIKGSITNSTFKNVKKGLLTESEAENYLKMVMNSPIIMVTAGGLKERLAYFIVHAANYRFFRGVLALIIGR